MHSIKEYKFAGIIKNQELIEKQKNDFGMINAEKEISVTIKNMMDDINSV